jgi:hypothetical protein
VRPERLMESLYISLEATSLSTWLRESPSLWAFPFVLILHTVGLAFFVGANVAWDVRVLGFSVGIPLDALRRYFVVMWVGFWVNAFSGVLLLLAYPTKALTNPLFYAKLALIAFGIVLAFRIRREVDRFGGAEAPPLARTLAAASLACWIAVIFAGRLLAYTCTRLTVDFPC